MPTFSSDLLPDQSGRNLGNGSQTWNAYIGTATATGAITSSSTVSGTQLISTTTTGTSPLTVNSTTKVTNLNADQLDGADWTAPGAIGSVTPSTGAFTTLTATSLVLGGGAPLTASGQTGTGSLVLATSPVIGTPSITNPTVTTGTFATPAITNPVISGSTGTATLKTLTLYPVTGETINVGGAAQVNCVPVTVNANLTSAQNLMNYVVPAGLLNSLLRGFRIIGAGVYTTQSAQTPTITIAVNLGGLTLGTWTTGATTASQSNLPWNFELWGITNATGATGNLEVHGNLDARIGSGAGSATTYQDGNTAVSSSIDLTSAQTLQVTVTFSTNAATANIAIQRLLLFEVMN